MNMKKLLFIIFFPITIPIYLIYRFFVWLSDTFIPFLQYDIFPSFADKLFPAIKNLIQSIKDKSAEKEVEKSSKINGNFEEDNKEIFSKKDIIERTSLATEEKPSQITIFDDIIIAVTDDDKYDWLFELPDNKDNYSLNDKVYLMFCWLGSDKNNLKRCTTPEKFFENLISTITILKKLTKLEELKKYNFYEPFPSEQLNEITNRNNYINMINDFIKRYWYKLCKEASAYKTDEKRYEKINSFRYGLLPFEKYFLPECKNYIQELDKMDIDIHNLPTAPKEVQPFDIYTEKILLRQLKCAQNALDRHFCYNELIDFYYKYRNDYPEAVQQCFKYCIEDIESLQETNDTYYQERINGIKSLYRNDPNELSKELDAIKPKKSYFRIPAFDRITMLFFYEKDYERAILYCRSAIEYDQDYDLKFTKRIERIKKKRAKEENAKFGSELLHLD